MWSREAWTGQEEATKDRPCAVVIALRGEQDRTHVYVLPITHSAPTTEEDAIEIPAPTKLRLGLDAERSWIVVSEANAFAWPGPDLRFAPDNGPASAVYGLLPPGVFRVVRDRFLAADRMRKPKIVPRTD